MGVELRAVTCEDCTSLALARLNGRDLCAACLFATLSKNYAHADVVAESVYVAHRRSSSFPPIPPAAVIDEQIEPVCPPEPLR